MKFRYDDRVKTWIRENVPSDREGRYYCPLITCGYITRNDEDIHKHILSHVTKDWWDSEIIDWLRLLKNEGQDRIIEKEELISYNELNG